MSKEEDRIRMIFLKRTNLRHLAQFYETTIVYRKVKIYNFLFNSYMLFLNFSQKDLQLQKI